jgi:hypothetical protein
MGEPDLSSTPELWRQLWDRVRDKQLELWKSAYPCTRPRAFWVHELPHAGQRAQETDPEYLYRAGVIGDDEIRRALEIVILKIRHNASCDSYAKRSGAISSGMFHSDSERYSEVDRFVWDHRHDIELDADEELALEGVDQAEIDKLLAEENASFSSVIT